MVVTVAVGAWSLAKELSHGRRGEKKIREKLNKNTKSLADITKTLPETRSQKKSEGCKYMWLARESESGHLFLAPSKKL